MVGIEPFEKYTNRQFIIGFVDKESTIGKYYENILWMYSMSAPEYY